MSVVRFVNIFIILLHATYVVSQITPSDIDVQISEDISQTSYDRIASEIDYAKTKKAIRPRKPRKQTAQDGDIKTDGTVEGPGETGEAQRRDTIRETEGGFQVLPIFQILAYVAIALLVGFLVYFIFSRIDVDKKFERSDTYIVKDDEIEDINDLDTPSLLEQALAKEDYRGAVRIQFLSILQKLSQKEKIVWRKEKTNHEYARDLRGETYGTNFQEMANIFDYVWYGKRDVIREQYDQIDKEFSSFKMMMNEK